MPVNAFGLDPQDPLIPMPWQMDSIRAYRAENARAAEENALKMEELRLDVAKKRYAQEMDSPSGRATKADLVARELEQMRQKEEGVDISKTPNVAGKSLLDMTKEEGQRLINKRAKDARQMALENYLLEKSILPKAKYEAGGVSGEALLTQAPKTQSNVRRQVYQNDYNDFYDMYLHAGQSPQVAHENAVTAAGQKQMKADSSGKVTVMLPNFGSLTTTPEKLNKLYNAPDTPEPVRNAIGTQWAGEQKKASGSDWVRNKLGY
jgi:hypothetical protein